MIIIESRSVWVCPCRVSNQAPLHVYTRIYQFPVSHLLSPKACVDQVPQLSLTLTLHELVVLSYGDLNPSGVERDLNRATNQAYQLLNGLKKFPEILCMINKKGEFGMLS